LLIAFKKENSCFRKGPLEMGITYFLTACAVFFTIGFFGTFLPDGCTMRSLALKGSALYLQSHKGLQGKSIFPIPGTVLSSAWATGSWCLAMEMISRSILAIMGS